MEFGVEGYPRIDLQTSISGYASPNIDNARVLIHVQLVHIFAFETCDSWTTPGMENTRNGVFEDLHL